METMTSPSLETKPADRGRRSPVLGSAGEVPADPLNTSLFPHKETGLSDGQLGQPNQGNSRWLSVDQIRKMQRMRRDRVIEAMENGELPYEQRGRIRYARLTDVLAWEERRLQPDYQPTTRKLRADLVEFG